jgi:CRISPR-associated protein Cmr2
MPDTYLALTIGPIHKTLKSVESTKAIWAASYMFSWIVREVIKDLKDTHTFLVPYTKEARYFNPQNIKKLGVGLFPDRFVCQANETDIVYLQKIIKSVLERFARAATADLTSTSQSRVDDFYKSRTNDMAGFLSKYVRAYALEITIKEAENPLEKANQYLDSLELQDSYIAEEDAPYLKDLFENVYYNFLIEEGFPDEKFPSTIEIATKPLQIFGESTYLKCTNILRKDERLRPSERRGGQVQDTQQRFLDCLRKDDRIGKEMRFHHKYIAVVQADGDNMGEFIKQLFVHENDSKGNLLPVNDRFSRFSKQLLKFSACAVELIKAYGGTPVYAGGDDLLYFAPAATTGGIEPKEVEFEDDKPFNFFSEGILAGSEPQRKSVLWLVDKIDRLFNKLIIDEFKHIVEKCEKKPSLSFGVSLSYYKFPLNEALENGMRLLFEEAKRGKKDSVSYAVLKHSGQSFGATYSQKKDSKSYKEFLAMLHGDTQIDEKTFLSSVMYKLHKQKLVLQHAAENANSLEEFFKNNFNEAVHSGAKSKYLDNVRGLVFAVFKEDVATSLETKIQKIAGSLRFIHFLMDDYHE